MFQIMEQPRPEKMFHEQYAFFSSTSRYMQAHFERSRMRCIERAFSPAGPIRSWSSSAATTASCCVTFTARHVSSRRRAVGECRRRCARQWHPHHQRILRSQARRRHRQRARPCRCNPRRECDVPHSGSPGVAAGVQRLLKPDGVFMFEDPYLGDMIAKTSYDQIYDEHVFIFSATSVSRAFAAHGLELVDVVPQVTHGGSMRYMLAPKGSRAGSAACRRATRARARARSRQSRDLRAFQGKIAKFRAAG